MSGQSKIPRMRGTGMTELNAGRILRMRRNGLFGEQSLPIKTLEKLCKI